MPERFKKDVLTADLSTRKHGATVLFGCSETINKEGKFQKIFADGCV